MHCYKQKTLPINFGKMYLNPGKNCVHVLVIIMLPQTSVKVYCGVTKIYKLTKKHFFLNHGMIIIFFLVNTLINKDGGFLSYNQFTNIYGGVKTNF